MISLACSNCQATLSIDDAFAGGVCRCQHCGTIQTVPKKSDASAAGDSTASRTLYKSQSRGDSGTGLSALGDVVTSSGLRSKRLTSPGTAAATRETAKSKSHTTQLLILVALVVVLGGAVAYLTLSPRISSSSSATVVTSPGVPSNDAVVSATVDAAPVNAAGPHFLDVSLKDAKVVVYLLDRGDGTREYFGELVGATLNSIRSLGPDRKFQIVFWDNGDDASEYPRGAASYATKENASAAEKFAGDVVPHGKTDALKPFQSALKSGPDTIVLATAKGWSLEDSFTTELLEARGPSKVKVHTVNLGGDDTQAPLKTLAAKTGGEARVASASTLRDAGK